MTWLASYFERVGYAGPSAPTLATLDALCAAHVTAIPFENIDVLLGRGIQLDPDAVEHKLVHARRGGYCFEQNSLFSRVLGELGFHVTAHGARVRYQRPRDYLPPRTHLYLCVHLEGETRVVDVGIGGQTLSASIRLVEGEEQTTPHETRRWLRDGALWFHQIRFGDAWHDLYEATLDDMPPIDRELANWYTSTHPASHFKQHLLVGRALPDGGRKSLFDRDFTVRTRAGTSTRRLESPADVTRTLIDEFGLGLAPDTRLHVPAIEW